MKKKTKKTGWVGEYSMTILNDKRPVKLTGVILEKPTAYQSSSSAAVAIAIGAIMGAILAS